MRAVKARHRCGLTPMMQTPIMFGVESMRYRRPRSRAERRERAEDREFTHQQPGGHRPSFRFIQRQLMSSR
jgi:hypothetical protein